MNRVEASIGSLAFFFIAPGAVAGLIPWWITRWRLGDDANPVAGGILIALSLAMLIECFVRFALRGLGTPAPIAPTQHLVITGLYRFVRNPMYLAVLGLIFGQMLLFGSAALLAYGIAIWIAFYVFVVSYEEPTLRRSFPEEYAAYFENVPRWLPRLTPWKGPEKTQP
jgi:protein-S-isoprenylcysteine O-methyltransferase Ste14